MRFLTYNILDGALGRERELLEILAALDADVVVLQEVLGREVVDKAAGQGRYESFVAESNSGSRIALLSRVPIKRATSFRPSILRHTCLEATLEYAPNQRISLFGVHLSAPAFTLPIELYRLRELSAILKRVRGAGGERMIVAGDFNSIAPEDRLELQTLPFRLRLSVIMQGGYFARQVIGRMRRNKFVDAFRELNPSEKGYTFPAAKPDTRFDYFFVNEGLRGNLQECEVVETPGAVRRASDHLPVRMELAL